MGKNSVILVCFESCTSKLETVAAEDVGCSLRTLYINLHSHILALSLVLCWTGSANCLRVSSTDTSRTLHPQTYFLED